MAAVKTSSAGTLCALLALLSGCGGDDAPSIDGGSDAPSVVDAGSDAALPSDAGVDAPLPVDAGVDAPPGCTALVDCDDGLFCNGTEMCAAGACVPGTPPLLDDGVDCTTDTCDETLALIVNTPNDAACADGDACTTDTCSVGVGCSHPYVCACAIAADCDDGNACTDDGCTAGSCTYVDNTAPCADGIFCNGADVCAAGACTHAGDPCAGGAVCAATCDETASSCFATTGTACTDDANPCTDDLCDGTGTCAHANNAAPCDDALYCNGADLCAGGACGHAGDPCAAGAECNDACDETADSCATAAGVGCASDSNPCTSDVCSGSGTCGHPPSIAGLACGDLTPTDCQRSACNGSGLCDQIYAAQSIGAPCADALFCNGADTCDAARGCTVHAGDPCAPSFCDEGADTCATRPHFVSVVTGDIHSCGLTADGVAYCWGNDGPYGQLGNGSGGSSQSPAPIDTSTISGVTRLVQLTAGMYHTCALTAAGVAYCWGADGNGRLGNGGTSVNVQSPTRVDTSTIAGNTEFVQLTAGGSATCGLTVDGVAYCWGLDGAGQLGNGSAVTGDQQSPSGVVTSPITGNTRFVQLTAGFGHACGLMADGAVYCWGSDMDGQLGNGATGSAVSPSRVSTSTITGNTAFTQLSAGFEHTCGRTADGVAHCWGDNGEGQLGNSARPTDAQSPSAVITTGIPGNTRFAQLSAGGSLGGSHTCGLTADGVSYCWGNAGSGQLGTGSTLTVDSPRAVSTSTIAGNRTFVELSVGGTHSCGNTADGVAYCWGRDTEGQLGDGGVAGSTASPAAVDMASVVYSAAFVELAGGGYHTCGRTPDGRVHCWGDDTYGQLGNVGASVSVQSPDDLNTATIPGNTAFVQIVGAESRTCGITATGVAYCWGYDGSGALGNGSILGNTMSPSAVDTSTMTGNTAFVQLAMGRSHSCGLTAIGAVYCWGSDTDGRLGNGGTSLSTQSPTLVDTSTVLGNTAFIRITSGLYYTCAIAADGAAYCWGYDGVGDLGNGSVSGSQQSPSAVDTSGITGNRAWTHLAAGWDQTCARAADGASYCWGYDSVGQLGNGGTSLDATSPSPIDSSTIAGNEPLVMFAGGGDHQCGLTVDGVPYCWGEDASGQLGNGVALASSQSPSPVDRSTIVGVSLFVQVTAGFNHSCGIAADGRAYCWGVDASGQLGNGGGALGTQSPSGVNMAGL